ETPDGQPEGGAEWMGSSPLIDRILFANYASLSDFDPSFETTVPMLDAGVDLADPVAVADFWLNRFFQTTVTPTERVIAIDYLSRDGSGTPTPLVPGTAEFDLRIRSFIGFLLSSPHANCQ
ncbi:MAG: hypothetical protein KDC38_13740, partial [Planctomycetes bacterium]|nr:hypothetical protein [Planctomycetota bacterium]